MKYENISMDICSSDEVAAMNLIKNAAYFLCKELIIDIRDFKVHFLMSFDYITDAKKVHHSNEDIGYPNASFIAPYNQSDAYVNKGVPIIIINLAKLRNAPQVFKESVIVHELVHYYDYIISGAHFSNKYKVNLSDNGILIAYFQTRSEMRAKFYQEKYTYISNETSYHSLRHLRETLTPINESDIFYSLSHAKGQLHYWDSLVLQPALKQFVEKEKSKIAKYEKLNGIIDLTEIFEINGFFEFCNKTSKK